ncbi:MAG: tRNA 2-thiouridine(34) synthase MnmA [Emergencia sp.]
MNNKRALIAMSGGVDSSVSAWLMKERGFDCIGVTMKLFHNEDVGISRSHTCCSLDDVLDAEAVAGSIGIRHYVFNFSQRFREDVMDPFVRDYENGRTPNPCIRCNRFLKFDKLFVRAKELDLDYVVTGHYARICQDENSGRYLLKKAADPSKDQSYVLYTMTQEQLAHTIFPLGDMTKAQTRRIAEEQGFINARKHDSQDICFVQSGSYADFITAYTGRTCPAGDFTDESGRVLGRHKGIIHYTIGQRKGLGIAFPQPMYVKEIRPDDNTVVLGPESSLYTRALTAGDINLISVPELTEPVRLRAQIRYGHIPQPAQVIQTDEDTLQITFDEPQRAVTPGQAVVLYDGDTVAGGGVIRQSL